MRNRADGTRKITRVPHRTQRAERNVRDANRERVHLVQVRTDRKKGHTRRTLYFLQRQVALTVV